MKECGSIIDCLNECPGIAYIVINCLCAHAWLVRKVLLGPCTQFLVCKIAQRSFTRKPTYKLLVHTRAHTTLIYVRPHTGSASTHRIHSYVRLHHLKLYSGTRLYVYPMHAKWLGPIRYIFGTISVSVNWPPNYLLKSVQFRYGDVIR